MKPKLPLLTLSMATPLLFLARHKDKNTPLDNAAHSAYVMPKGQAVKIIGRWQVGVLLLINILRV